jgi:dihydroxyacetone kinase-like predicted kinase
VLERLLDAGADVLTILHGEGAEGLDDLVSFVGEEHPELEIEVHDGGQPHYALLFGAE